MTFLLGLTGSIGMGKSTTAKMFAEMGCDIWDADNAVTEIYAIGGTGVKAFLSAGYQVVEDNAVSKPLLKAWIVNDPDALKQIEAIVHPLVADHRRHFIENSSADIVVLEIPLLFETNAQMDMDATACVSIDAETQKKRVLARGSMDEAEFNTIVARQMSDIEKRNKADFLIVTDSLESTQRQVQNIVEQIRASIDA